MPQALFQRKTDALSDAFRYHLNVNVEVLFIVVDTQPDLQAVDNHPNVQQWWELENTQRGAFLWNYERDSFDFQDDDHVADELLYSLVDEIKEGLGDWLTKEPYRRFEIRFVFAVKR